MKSLLLALLSIGLLTSCSKKRFDGIDSLEAHVKKAIEDNRPGEITDAVHWEGVDPEVREVMTGFFESMDFSELPLVEFQVHDFESYEPNMELPGQINGRDLKWTSEPSHYMVARLSNKDDDGNGSELNLSLAAGEVGGRWWLIGATYSDEAVPQDIEVSGLTDKNVTLIAFDDENKVVDFVHVEEGSGIQQILFHAPEDGSRLSVAVVGPARHQLVPDRFVVSSVVGEGMRWMALPILTL